MISDKKFIKIGNKFFPERVCLIDIEAFPGNSGSPVINQPSIIDRKIELLGLLIATNVRMDFAIVEPVSRIRETLELAKEQSVEGLEVWFPLDEGNPEN